MLWYFAVLDALSLVRWSTNWTNGQYCATC